jgi:adenosylhomocysteine nucleosidase
LTPATPTIAIVAALEREVAPLVKRWTRVPRRHDNRDYTFFEHENSVCLCGGIGAQAARRAAEAVIALYRPALLHSVGFAGALDATLHIGNIMTPALVLDARDGSRFPLPHGQGTLITFMEVAGTSQKEKLASAYAAQAVDMESAAVAAAATAHAIPFAATKVISDEADFEIPGISRFIDSQGQFNTAGFALATVIRPWLWKRLATLAFNSNQAANALSAYLERHPFDERNLAIPAGTAFTSGGIQ